jgi:hypothetical protein
MLCAVDEFTREALAIAVAHRLDADDVLRTPTDLFVEPGPTDHLRFSRDVRCRPGGHIRRTTARVRGL